MKIYKLKKPSSESMTIARYEVVKVVNKFVHLRYAHTDYSWTVTETFFNAKFEIEKTYKVILPLP